MKRRRSVESLTRTATRLTALLLLVAFLCTSVAFVGQTHAQNAKQQAQRAARNDARTRARYPALSRYAIDLTKLARQGRLDALAGHEAEIRRAAQLLAQGSPLNPVLLTDSSVSAPALAQSLALSIARGDAPESLRHKRLFSLNLNALSANAKTPEEFAARLQSALSEALDAKGEVILFVNSLEQFVGGRANLAVSNALRDALADNQLRVLGAASPEAFAEINADASLSPLFQPIHIGEDVNATAEKRDGVKLNVEEFEGDKVSSDLREMIESASSGSDRVSVILQADDVKDAELLEMLKRSGARVNSEMAQLGALRVEMPISAVERLAANDHARHLSPDREYRSFGHVTLTSGADAVRNPSSNSLLGGILGTNTTLDGTGIGIAIVDSGMDVAHRAFKDRVRFKMDFTTENNSDKDPYGHGTHVASTAAGVSPSNGSTYSGIAPNANIINLRVLNAQGSGKSSDLLKALNWILSPANATLPVSSSNPLNKDKYNIRVVNLSLGAPAIDSYKNDPVCRAVRQLVDNGIVVVAAAGNNGKDSTGRKIYGQIHSPGNEPSAITVGATNTFGTDTRSDDGIATYSSRGPTRSHWTDASGVVHYDNLVKPDLVAPGNKLIYAESDDKDKPNLIVSQHPELDSGITDDDNKKMMYLSGTSMATPVVAGAAALMLQAFPKLTPNMVKAILMYTAQQLKGFNTLEQGAGQVNIEGAMRLAKAIRTDLTNNTPVGDPLLSSASPDPQTTIAGYTFPWSRGLIMNYNFVTGSNLMTKYQKIYGTGILVGDGVMVSDGILVGDRTMMSDGILVGDSILTSNGGVLSDGSPFLASGILVGDAILVGDGVMVGDGILVGDAILVGDGILVGDAYVQAMSAMVGGDETSCMQ